MSRPRVAVLLDENTSSGGHRYEAAKGYFLGVSRAGGLPYGLPYDGEVAADALALCDALLLPGGRYAMPADWYAGEPAASPDTDRLEVEVALATGFLQAGKPVLGICAGMQVMAALAGCKLTAKVDGHNGREIRHAVRTTPGTLLRQLVGERLEVNSFHNEAIATLAPGVAGAAVADDGVIEAIELPGAGFALGVQWHQELFAHEDHPGNAIFQGLIDACGAPR
jgi:putative glutamine amidotransferase